jgi:AraC family ethanolamine operon transcriptional activator
VKWNDDSKHQYTCTWHLFAFREKFGITPKQYLQATRLQRVRERILRSDPSSSIAENAAHWGFWHMGQFAADYRNQFGELPSQTMRRNF